MFKRLVAVGLVAFLAVAGLGRAEDKKPKDPPKDPLPRTDSVKWDVTTFEDSPMFVHVKREVKGGEVVWVLENRKDIATDHIFGWKAVFLDDDGVKLFEVGIATTPFPPNLRLGERNRYTLELPRPENWKGVKQVVIKGGAS